MKLFYSTDEVAKHFGVNESQIRHYVKEFGLKINTVGRVKKYTHKDIEKLDQILRLIEEEKYTIEGAKEKLKTKEVKADHNTELIQKLKDIRITLELLKNSIEN
jgi:DNA-binding transcriptional MerR regulator